jgi:ComF family protein
MSVKLALVDLRTRIHAVLDLLFPRLCLGCDVELAGAEVLVCGPCRVVLEAPFAARCRKCAQEVDASRRSASSCPACRSSDFAFQGVVAALRYRGPVRGIVLSIKFGRRAEGADVLATRLVAAIVHARLERRIDVVVPVPLHPLRRLVRGFDQAELLARAVARRLHKPIATRALWRRRYTRQQARLDRAHRSGNVSAIFGAGLRARRVRGKRVLLVDDVMTSGATANAAALALRALGARTVTVAVAARG